MVNIRSISSYSFSANSRYFAIGQQLEEVDQTTVGVLTQQLLARAKERQADAQRRMYEIHDTNILQELSPWLRRTVWMTRFDGKNMKTLYDLLIEPKQNPRNPEKLRHVWESVARVTERCWESVRDCSTRNWGLILHWLASASKTEHNPTPFSIYTQRSTRKDYTIYWQQFMMFVLRGMNDPDEYGIEYTAGQLIALKDIKREIEKENISDEELDQKISAASQLFIRHSNFVKQRSALLYFTGVIGYHLGWKRWRGPDSYTPTLAGIQWIMRLLVLESAIPKDKRDDWFEFYEEDPLERFNLCHHKFLVEGEAYPYDQIHRLLNYGMKASINITSRSRIDWSSDRSILYLDGRPLKIKDWKRLSTLFNY